MFIFKFRFGLLWYDFVLVRLAYTPNFIGLGCRERTFPGGWLDGVVEKLGKKANLRSFKNLFMEKIPKDNHNLTQFIGSLISHIKVPHYESSAQTS